MSFKPITALACVLTTMLTGCAGMYSHSARSDGDITAAIQARYVNDRTVNASAISVVTQDGVVTLRGNARDWTERTVAEQVALKVDDVRTIRNEIVILAPGNPA